MIVKQVWENGSTNTSLPKRRRLFRDGQAWRRTSNLTWFDLTSHLARKKLAEVGKERIALFNNKLNIQACSQVIYKLII